ncbi:hypothetical protein CDSM653_02115 [Caldanaerobacter subterraneus subsp. pacificus DSM 12653]|uniref:Uncharacterized protein n=1 Tax=Caldanaerobacter subterraneus subsp. pacificus DSM 12653 TaxID=391606 RepID=A0A0F5PKE6_9THEO|nr:hypothetical protein CDSM653_02115 [Caldanaerobacter subterraneus subsp. pacificus DSM 12653]
MKEKCQFSPKKYKKPGQCFLSGLFIFQTKGTVPFV